MELAAVLIPIQSKLWVEWTQAHTCMCHKTLVAVQMKLSVPRCNAFSLL